MMNVTASRLTLNYCCVVGGALRVDNPGTYGMPEGMP
jgi:hypothetical protein